MKKIFILLVSFLLFSALLFAGGAQEVSPKQADDGFTQVSAGEVEVLWRAGEEEIEFRITAPTTGWVSIGFDPSRAMKDANFIFGFVKEGEVHIEDHYGTGTFSHKKDTDLGGSRDILDYSGSESNGETTLEFTIPLDSGDEYDTPLTLSREHTVLFAYGPDGADNFSEKHSSRGKVKITF